MEAKRASAKALYERAEKAAEARRFAEALAAYREAAEADPSAPFIPVARARADAIAARSEGDFKPLSRLDEARKDPAKLSARGALEAFEHDISLFPDGRVRSEARLVAAEAWRNLHNNTPRAEALLQAAVADPYADPLLRSLALNELVLLLRERGDLQAARAVVDRYPDLAPSLRGSIVRAVHRVYLRRAAFGVLGALALVFAASVAKAARSRPIHKVWLSLRSPLSFAFALYLGGAAAVLARVHGDADPRPFLWLGVGVLGVDMVARAWREASTDHRPIKRAARALACAAGVFAVAFLALELTNAVYLESLGL